MSGHQEVTYTLDLGAGRQSRRANQTFSEREMPDHEAAEGGIPRIARLLALAIRFEGLLRDETTWDYAELARLGRVTRARMTPLRLEYSARAVGRTPSTQARCPTQTKRDPTWTITQK